MVCGYVGDRFVFVVAVTAKGRGVLVMGLRCPSWL